ncbi:hypothetical protein Vadar_013233 [Vaccinium darrowii]|uniref:Uncharacterized protein n=1 Tax=Vaccinium darrowii TaxID=229202 RepID=A0ACB7X0F8_9ERIC|nr:hypothetical protein Vadar_013233 [Vaccinium darrowii]
MKQQSGRSTSINDLPIDISLNILKRLPISSLFSMKLVCKAFYHLASHPTLTPHYHDLHPWLIIRFKPSSSTVPYNNNQLYVIDDSKALRKIIQPRIKKTFTAGAILSCKGLLCLLYYKNTSTCLDYYRACLVNPLTGKHDYIPDPGLPRVRISSNKGNMVQSKQCFGFAFDPWRHEYKLVRIVGFLYENDQTYLQAEVFTLGKNGCQIYEMDSPFVCPDESSDVVVGGAIHWLCKKENSAQSDPKSRVILSFDLFEEKFHQIPIPDSENCEFRKISVLRGCLAITCSFRETCRTHEVHIWLLKEYDVKESWTKEFEITQGFEQLYPLFLLRNGKIVMSCGLKGLCYYDPRRNCLHDGAELDQPIVAICHAWSLVSPRIKKKKSIVPTLIRTI